MEKREICAILFIYKEHHERREIALNQDWNIIFWGLMAVAGAVVCWALYTARRKEKHSETTKKEISRVLRAMAPLREWKVLDRVTLSDKEGEITADHLVIGPFGVLVLSDLHRQGGYYGDLRDEEWVISTGGEDKVETMRIRIQSPVKNNQRFVAALRAVLTKAEVYNVPVEALCPATQSKIEIYVAGASAAVVEAGKLREALGRQKFQKDNGMDVGKIAALLAGQ